jgi:hypothetical protein
MNLYTFGLKSAVGMIKVKSLEIREIEYIYEKRPKIRGKQI